MGLLEKLWDDTVAGPQPDSGLGKLRKYNTFNFRSNSKDSDVVSARSVRDESTEDAMKVTRRIMIVKPPGYQGSPLVSPSGSTPPISPAGSTPPVSPFSARFLGDFWATLGAIRRVLRRGSSGRRSSQIPWRLL